MEEVINGFRFGVGLFGSLLAFIVILAIIVAVAEEYNELKRQKTGKSKNGKKTKHDKR